MGFAPDGQHIERQGKHRGCGRIFLQDSAIPPGQRARAEQPGRHLLQAGQVREGKGAFREIALHRPRKLEPLLRHGADAVQDAGLRRGFRLDDAGTGKGFRAPGEHGDASAAYPAREGRILKTGRRFRDVKQGDGRGPRTRAKVRQAREAAKGREPAIHGPP